MNEDRVKEVFSDEEFVKELFSKETPEEAQAMLAEKDIEVSVEELVKLRDLLIKKAQQAEGSEELNDDELEDVSGGIIGFAIAMLVGGALLGGLFITAGVMEEKGRRW